MQEQHIWHMTLERLRKNIDPSVFSIWFQDTRVLSWQGEVFLVGVPTTFTKAHLELRYLDQIRAAISEVIGHEVPVQLVVSRGLLLKNDILPAQFDEECDENDAATFLVVVSKEPSCYKASVPDIPGCVATGETRDEAVQSVREALQTYVEMRYTDRLPVPEAQTTAHYLRLLLPLDQEQGSNQALQDAGSMALKPPRCSFCHAQQDQNISLTTGPGGVHICRPCVEHCREMIESGIVDFQQLKRSLASRQREVI